LEKAMSEPIKTGREVIDQFFLNALNVADTDKAVVELLISLHKAGTLTDTKIQQSLDQMLQAAMEPAKDGDNEN
jgi:hypothetical protein